MQNAEHNAEKFVRFNFTVGRCSCDRRWWEC